MIFYGNWDELKNDERGTEDNIPRNQFWSFVPDDNIDSDELFVALRFDIYNQGDETIAKDLSEIVKRNDFAAKREERTNFWNDFFAKVPRPMNFSFDIQKDNDVSEQQVKNMYYKAWALIYSSVLPEGPEVGFNYKQVCCGKPSMWGFGAESATYSAAWESFVAIQFLSYVEPDIAWNAFEGLMSLVDDDGVLGGESLPSYKAQTAWVVYNNKKDKEALERITPALERYLNWRMENPRWIIESNEVNGERDLDFISNALVDIDYAVRIFKELGNEEKATEWENKGKDYYKQFQEWMIYKNNVYLTYNDITQRRSTGNVLWLSKGLHIPNITDEDFDLFYKNFKGAYRANASLGGFHTVKFDSMQYPIYSFIEKGGDYLEIAQNLVEITYRDVASTNFLAEVYNSGGKKIFADGVRPSMFGAGLMIDNVLIKNGFMYYEGRPKVINLYGTSGGVENIHINGDTFNVVQTGSENKIKLGGTFFESEQEIVLEVGETKIFE